MTTALLYPNPNRRKKNEKKKQKKQDRRWNVDKPSSTLDP